MVFKSSYGFSVILTCEKCGTRYLVPSSAIGEEGRSVRCKKCHHEWFQEFPADEPLPPPAPEEDGGFEPIPDAVKPEREYETMPIVPEDETSGSFTPGQERLGGYAAALLVFLIIGALLFNFRGMFIPAADGAALGLDRISAVAAVNEKGVTVLNIEGHIANLKEGAVHVPALHIELVRADGGVFDSWQVEPPKTELAAHEDVVFKASYPEVPEDVKEARVKFASGH